MKKILIILAFAMPQWISAQDISLDQELGKEAAKQVEIQMGLYDAPITAEYIDAIGKRLAGSVKQPFSFQFQLVDSPMPNAFALPGGYIYVTRGLLSLANNEDELGGVIGHEITHVLERHSVKQMKKSIVPALLMVPGALVGKVSTGLGNLITAPVELTSKVFLASYSRKQETEADAIGVRLAAASGYNPQNLAVILQNLTKAVEYVSGEGEKKSYFDGHPMTDDRVKTIEKYGEKYPVARIAPFASSSTEFYDKLDGIIFGENPAQGVFKNNLFLHPDLKVAMQFPLEWKSMNTPTEVAAYDKDEKSMVFLSVKDTISDPTDLASQVEKSISEKYNLKAEESKKMEIDGMAGHYLQYRDDNEENVKYLSLLFVLKNNLIYQLTGLGSSDHETLLKNSVLSFRNITADEIKNISVKVIRIANAQEGESLTDFNTRTGNKWTSEFTAIANDIDSKSILKEGHVLKIIKEEPYLSGGK